MIEMLQPDVRAEQFLRDPDCSGGSVVVAPNSRVVVGPMGAEEGILYAQCDLELGITMKLRHDFAGHYNRPDIFHLQINRAVPKLYSVHGTGGDVRVLSMPDGQAQLEADASEMPLPSSGDDHGAGEK